MGTYLDPDQFPGVADAAQLISELEAHLSLHYPIPEPLPDERKAILVALLVPVIERWTEVGAGLGSTEVTGPFQFRTPGGGGHVLWPREIADLKAFCGAAVNNTAVPLGAFPPDTDPLFSRRPW